MMLDEAAARFSPENSPAPRILVTDDKSETVSLVTRSLGDWQCEFAADLERAEAKLDTADSELVICALGAAGWEGLKLAEKIVDRHPDTATVVLMTGERL